MISNRSELCTAPAHEVALDCLAAGIRAASPSLATRAAVSRSDDTLTVAGSSYDLSAYDEVVIVGGGKAAGGVTTTLEEVLGARITAGSIVTKGPVETRYVDVAVGDHPLPSERNVRAVDGLLGLLDDADERTLVLAVVTGGSSALLTRPAGALTVDDLRATTELLLDAGAPIEDVNTVRTHLSAVKGGRLAARAAPATVVGLLVSDVVGDDPSLVGSGPTVPSRTSPGDALAVLDRYGLTPPPAVREHLGATSADADVGSTPADPTAEIADTHVVCDSGVALDGAASAATDAGYTPLVLTSRLRGEASEVARPLVAIAEEALASDRPVAPPAVLLAGGECTVSVAGEGGSGGPNQELALSAARDLDGPIVLGAVDTDGEDGSSAVAGALVDASTVDDDDAAADALVRNDAGSYLADRGRTIHTGRTGTNVNDLVVVVIPSDRN